MRNRQQIENLKTTPGVNTLKIKRHGRPTEVFQELSGHGAATWFGIAGGKA
jgi:hypothetical protein